MASDDHAGSIDASLSFLFSSFPLSLAHLAQEAEVVSELVLGVRPQGLLHHLVLAHEEAGGGREGREGREGSVSGTYRKVFCASFSLLIEELKEEGR